MSYFTLEQFKAETLSRDLARPNLFEVMITPPSSLSTNDAKIVSLLCDSAAIPSQRIVTKRLNIYGETYPRPVTAQYGEIINLTFLVDSDMIIRKFFEKWLDLIVNRDSNHVSYQTALNSGSYIANSLSIFQLKKKEFSVSHQTQFEEVFPVSIQMLDLDNNQFNSVHRMNVTFEYRKWREVGDVANQSQFKNSSTSDVNEFIKQSKSTFGEAFPEFDGDVQIVDGNVLGGVSSDAFNTSESNGELFGNGIGNNNQGDLNNIEIFAGNTEFDDFNNDSDLTQIITLA